MPQIVSKALSNEFVQRAIEHPEELICCQDLHRGMTCESKFLNQFFSSCKSLSKMYLVVHLVPFILFKRKKLKQDPKKEIVKLLIAFLKSMIFAGGYSALVRYGICSWTRLKNYQSKCAGPVAILAGISLIFEPKGRQSEIALFCLNKSLQTTYNMLLRRGYPVRIPYGQCLLMGVAMGLLCYHYFNNEDSIRQNYKKIVDKLLKDS